VRNAIDDLVFLDQVIGIELSNLGHCFHLMYPPEGGNPPPIEGGVLKRKRDRERGKETEKEEKRQEKEKKRQEKEKKRQEKRKSKR